jgi:hypothetical protein
MHSQVSIDSRDSHKINILFILQSVATTLREQSSSQASLSREIQVPACYTAWLQNLTYKMSPRYICILLTIQN